MCNQKVHPKKENPSKRESPNDVPGKEFGVKRESKPEERFQKKAQARFLLDDEMLKKANQKRSAQ